MISLQAGHVGTAVRLAQQLRLAFSTSAGPCFKCSDLAKHINVELGFYISPVEIPNVNNCLHLMQLRITIKLSPVVEEIFKSFS